MKTMNGKRYWKKTHLPISRKMGILLLVVGAIIGVVGGAMISIGIDARKNAIMTLSGELMPFNIDMSKPFTVALSAGVNFVFSNTSLANGINMNDILPANFTTDQIQIQFKYITCAHARVNIET